MKAAGTYTDISVHCDRCENEATVHEVTISNGQVLEIHLCEGCAQEAGVVADAPVPVAELLQKIAGRDTSEQEPPAVPTCGVCGTTFAQFKQSGRLGCPECYLVLEAQLAPILDRAHQGAVHHVGKVPKRLVGQSGETAGMVDRAAALAAADARAEQIRRLRADLASAIHAEHYEQAAQIRDRLRRLQQGTASAEDPT